MVHVKKEQQQKEQQELGNIFLKQKKYWIDNLRNT